MRAGREIARERSPRIFAPFRARFINRAICGAVSSRRRRSRVSLPLRCVKSSRGSAPAAAFQEFAIVQRSATVSRLLSLSLFLLSPSVCDQSTRRLRQPGKRNGGRFERVRLFRGFEGKSAARGG